MPLCHTAQRGFTLIELSIVLVIIGLVVGGVLVGQDLIRAAQGRAQISQIEKYNTAANTFRDKYGALPGDLTQQIAIQFQFAQRGSYRGEGDGNGLIEGSYDCPTCFSGSFTVGGEVMLFWVDLTRASLMAEGVITTNPITGYEGECCGVTAAANGTLDGSLPAAGLEEAITYTYTVALRLL